jgi:hypothetical protein
MDGKMSAEKMENGTKTRAGKRKQRSVIAVVVALVLVAGVVTVGVMNVGSRAGTAPPSNLDGYYMLSAGDRQFCAGPMRLVVATSRNAISGPYSDSACVNLEPTE